LTKVNLEPPNVGHKKSDEEDIIRVLHVDNEVGLLKVAKQILEMQGSFEVETAASVEEAQEKMRKKEFDVIVSDYQMPIKDGLEFLRELRLKSNTIPFILFTGKGREEIVIEALNLGADRYFNKIGKPETVYSELAHGISTVVKGKKAEEELRKTKNYLSNLLDYANAPIIVWDNKKRITLFNNAFESLTGHKKESMLGRNIDVLFPPLQKEAIMQNIETATKGEKWKSVEIPILCKDKETKIVLWNSANISDIEDKTVATIAQGQDITKRKKTDEALKASEEKYRSLFESSQEGILFSDSEGKISSVNSAFSAMLGYDGPEELAGIPAVELYVDPKARNTLFKELKKNGYVKDYELDFRKKDGSIVNIICTAVVRRDEKGNIIQTESIIRDMTERKRAEKALWDVKKEQGALRKSGIAVVGNVPWGTHLCQFYETVDDLVDVLVPYFAEGLRNNEFCMWVTSEPLSEKEAMEAMRKEVPNFDRYVKKGQIEIVPYTEWYLKGGAFNLQRVLDAWIDKLNQALSKGYDGLRVTGNTAWLEKKDWNSFADYEKEINDVIGNFRMMAICTYSLDRCGASEVIDVVSNHQFALIKRKGEWEIIESSQLKEVKEALQKSEIRLKQTFAASPNAISVTNTDGIIVECNQATLDLYGFSSKEEVIGKNALEFIAEKDHKNAMENLKKTLEQGSVKNVEYTFLTKDGHEFPAELSASVIKDFSGTPIGFVAVTEDITNRKKAEEMLRKSEERFRGVFEGATDGILAADPENQRFVFANPRMCEITGYTLEELLKLGVANLHTNEDLPYVIEQISKQVDVKFSITNNIPVLRKDQQVVYCDVNSRTINIGEKRYLVGFFRDITERKKAENALKDAFDELALVNEKLGDATEKWVSLTNNTDDSIMVVDGKGTIEYMNRAVPPYKPEEVIGTSVFEYIPRGLHELKRKSLRKVFTDGKTDDYVISSEVPKIGCMWFRTKVIPIKRDGKVVRSIEIVSDITERKRAEEKLQQMMDELMLINEKLEVVGKLTRHDVRNKLSSVTGNIYLAKQVLPPDSESVKYLNETESAVDQIEKIFDFARTYEQLGVEELSYVDVGKSFDAAVALLSDLGKIEVVNECKDLSVLADSLLGTLFYNLIDNTIRHGEKVNRIRIHHKTSKDGLKLIYDDDGVGIPEDEKELIFKEGYGKNTGLGLYMIKKMCNVYGWTIQETGKPGKGAQFTITIPKPNKNGKTAYTLH